MIGLFTQSAPHHLFQIPNFLHLTPAAIKKHCEALKRNTLIWSLIEWQYFFANTRQLSADSYFLVDLKISFSAVSILHRVALCFGHRRQMWRALPHQNAEHRLRFRRAIAQKSISSYCSPQSKSPALLFIYFSIGGFVTYYSLIYLGLCA